MNVFPKFLKQTWSDGSCDDVHIRDIIDHLVKLIDKERFYWEFLIQPQIFIKSELTLNEYFGQSRYITQCLTNDAFRAVIVWVNKNILLQLTKDTYITTNVKIRIATSMINKLVMQEKLDKDCGILAHDILVHNIKELQSLINTEDLPF